MPAVAKPPGQAAPQVSLPGEDIVDPGLTNDDMCVSLTVSVHGHKAVILDGAEFTRTFYAGMVYARRGLLFREFETFFDEIREAISIRVNTVVPVELPEEKSAVEPKPSQPAAFAGIKPWPAELDPKVLLHQEPDLGLQDDSLSEFPGPVGRQ